MRTMAPASAALHTNLSNDSHSSLSNGSLSENSTSSLDYEVRLLSNARTTTIMSGPAAASKQETDRDMTEDEVAIMVKNALRKARRAMNNSSPMSDDDDDSGKLDIDKFADSKESLDDDNSSAEGNNKYPNKYSDALDSLTPQSSSGGGVGLSAEDDEDEKSNDSGGKGKRRSGVDLARRIEEEIQSARAAAEKKYYSGTSSAGLSSENESTSSPKKSGTPRANSGVSPTRGESSPSSTPPPQSPVGRTRSSRSSQSVDTEMTPLVSNTTSSSPGSSKLNALLAASGASDIAGSSGTPRESARERMARSKDKIAAANELLLKKSSANTAAMTSSSPGKRPPMLPPSPTSPMASAPPGMGGSSPSNAKTPGADDFDAILAVSPGVSRIPSTVTALSPSSAASATSAASTAVARNNSNTTADTSVSGLMNTSMGSASSPVASPEKQQIGMESSDGVGFPHNAVANSGSGTVLTSNSHILNTSNASSTMTPSNNKPPLSVSTPNMSNMTTQPPPPPPNTNSNKPQQHRQVLFRHPYPLPPPPPLPRSDAIIISSHSAPDKNINIKWVEPDNDLAALIEAAGEEYNLVRRSNACGALKVLASKDSNRSKLCRTKGLLDVLVKASWDDAVDSDALDARTRAVTTLLYLSEPKDNRLIVAKHKQVLDVLVKVIEEDTGEARWRATSALATLAKTPGNRGSMGRVDKLATVLGDLMALGVQRKEEPKDETKKEGGKDGEENLRKNGTESREDQSTIQGEDSMTRGPSFDTMDDERMLTQTYTGTFTEGTGTTFTEDDMTYQSAYDSDTHTDEENEDMEDGEGSRSGDEEEDEEASNASNVYGTDDDGSMQEEEGVEMQISSLKKLNIENASDFLAKSQLSACATLTHLTKHCANAPTLCQNTPLLDNIIFLAGTFESPLHTRCIEMLCNFTRFPSNNAQLASMPKCIETLLHCGKSKIAEDRMWAIRTVQNLCSDASSKVGLATGAMLSLLSTAAMRKDYEEQYAAVGALMNLSTEPGSIVPLTNTKTVVATLVHLAHSPNTPAAVRKIACDSLATIGLWLQTLASAGTVPEEIPFSPLPTHSATGWLRWDNN